MNRRPSVSTAGSKLRHKQLPHSFEYNLAKDGGAKDQLQGKDFSTDVLLKFYGYYKQATVGPCDIPRPGYIQLQARAKWEAWKTLGNMSKETARRAYLKLLLSHAPQWRTWKGEIREVVQQVAPAHVQQGTADEVDVGGVEGTGSGGGRAGQHDVVTQGSGVGAHVPYAPPPEASSFVGLLWFACAVQTALLGCLSLSLVRSALGVLGEGTYDTSKWYGLGLAVWGVMRAHPQVSLSVSAFLFSILSFTCLKRAALGEWELLCSTLEMQHKRYTAVAQELLEARVRLQDGARASRAQAAPRDGPSTPVGVRALTNGASTPASRRTPFTPGGTPGNARGNVSLSSWGPEGFVFSSPGGPDVCLKVLPKGSTPNTTPLRS